MQSYPLPATQTNLMSDVTERLGRITKGVKKNFIKLAYQRDPDSLYDELLIGLLALLMIAVLATMLFGAYYHYQIFQGAFGIGTISVIGAFTAFLVMEIAKVFFGLHLARSLFSMLWYKSLYRFLFMLGIGAIVLVAFRWSISITTKGIAEINNNLKSTKIYKGEIFTPPPSIAAIDVQLSELNEAKKAGAKSTWKGRTTQKGIQVIQSNTDLQSDLLRQREILMTAAMARHDSLQSIRLKEVNVTSKTLTNYGGKAEYATMLLIVLVVLFEFINYEKNKTPIVPLKK